MRLGKENGRETRRKREYGREPREKENVEWYRKRMAAIRKEKMIETRGKKKKVAGKKMGGVVREKRKSLKLRKNIVTDLRKRKGVMDP